MKDTKVKKPSGYHYNINGTKVSSRKKLYKQNGIYGHKNGDFFEPCSPQLHYKIMMALLETKNV